MASSGRLFLAELVAIAGVAWWLLSPGVPAPLVAGVVLVGLVAVATLARSRGRELAPERERVSVYEAEPARPRASWRVRVWVGAGVLVCASVAAAAPALGRAGGRLSAPPTWALVAAGAGLLAASLVILRSGAGADQSLTDVSSGGGAEGLRRWQASVAARWAEGIRGVPKLVRRDPYDGTVLLGAAEVVEPVQPVAGGGVAFGVDLERAWAVGEDVAESVEQLRRVLGAALVLVEPVPAVDTFVVLTVYRGQPFTGRPGERPVSWRSLRPVEGDPEAVPVGEAAFADLLGGAQLDRGSVWDAVAAVVRDRSLRSARAALAAGPALSGRMAVLSKRGSLLLDGASDTGKSAGVRAVMSGLLVQGVPFRPLVWDNKGDYAALREAVEALGGRYVTSDEAGLELFREANRVGDLRYAGQGSAYEHHDTLAEPRYVVIVAEWLTAGESLSKTDRAELGRLALRVVTYLRGAGVILVTCAQLAEKAAGLGELRDAFPQVVTTRTTSAAQTKMALDGADVARGAAPHLIPLAARGVFYTRDRYSGWPYLARFAWIPEDDQDEALIRPMLAMAERMPGPRVIDGQAVTTERGAA